MVVATIAPVAGKENMSVQQTSSENFSFPSAENEGRFDHSVAPAQDKAASQSDGHPRFDIYRAERVGFTSTLFGGGDWHWRLTGSSGNVVADCGGYRNQAECRAVAETLRAEAGLAAMSTPT